MRHCGFSLLELLVVIAVALVLAGLLLPTMTQVRENAHRVVCSSHLRQIGLATVLYESDYDDLPYSWFMDVSKRPQELMAAHRGEDPANWEGLGLLHAGGYCRAPECYYCPSHHGGHTYERYQYHWFYYDAGHEFGTAASTSDDDGDDDGDDGDDGTEDGGDGAVEDVPGDMIYTNYHYSGSKDWLNPERRLRLDQGHPFVVAADGLRTALDFNHVVGMNLLNSDGSVLWQEDNDDIHGQLPTGALMSEEESDAYQQLLWGGVMGPMIN